MGEGRRRFREGEENFKQREIKKGEGGERGRWSGVYLAPARIV